MRSLVKIKDRYFEWSTISDAPNTYGMTLDELHEYIKEEYGRQGLESLPKRLERVEAKGCSAYEYPSVADFLSCNRAGPDETEISLDEIYRLYAHCPDNTECKEDQ